MAEEFPIQFGKYQLLGRIAQGGMADVFLARAFGAEGFEKRLVIKRILPGLSRSQRFVSMFIHEARILVTLNHPNIVQVYDLGQADSYHYIAMEHIHGRDLTRTVRTLRAGGRLLPLPLALHVVATALRGLGYAHALTDRDGNHLNIVHGDMSPHNLVLSFAGDVKIVDFGIARLAGSGAGDKPERPGGGKFAYMSPEQVHGFPLDRRSDIFSTGIVLYELLVGHRLYQHPDAEEKLRLVREAIIPDPRLENPNIPNDLWDILRQSLSLDPRDRYQRAEIFEEDLRAFLYANHHRADQATMGHFMTELFGESEAADPGAGDLRRLADDLQRLEKLGSDPESLGMDSRAARARLSEPDLAHRLPRPQEELKTVAVLTVETTGHTDLSARCDPTLVLERQREIMAWFETEARRFGGIVIPGGDDESVTIVFGVPKARGDDLERALACGLELQPGRPDWPDMPFQICIGVHLGEAAVTCPEDGSPPHVTGRGDTLKMTRRLAASAEYGEVRVSERVAQLAGDRFQFDTAAPIVMRVRGQTIQPFRCLGRRTDPLRQDLGSWLVRGNEIEILREAMVGLREGRGRMIVLTGETGVGKSRLIREIQQIAKRRGLAFHTTRAYPFGADRPMPALRDLVACIVGIEEADPYSEVQTKLNLLARLRLSPADIAVAAQLFLPDPSTRASPSVPMILEAARRIVVGLSDHPVAVIVEDIDNLDRMERKVLSHIAQVVRERPLLLLLSTSSQPPADIARLASSIIRLDPLTHESQARLVADLLDARDVDPELAALISADAAGNPLYAQEVVKAMESAGYIHRDGGRASLRGRPDELRIPHTLRGLVAARIDSLDPGAKAILQLGAIIGMLFPVRLLNEVAGIEGLEPVVDELVQRGLLLRVNRGGETMLEFASQMLWDVADRSIMGVQRRDNHRMVAQGMERLYAGKLEPHLEALARHAAAAGSFLDAARYLSRVGDVHRGSAFLDRALHCYQMALQWLQEHRDQGDSKPEDRLFGEVSLHRRCGEVAFLLGNNRKAEHYLQLALDDAAEFGISHEEAATCLALGRLCINEGRRFEARAYLEQVRDLTNDADLGELRLESLEALGQLAYDEGRLAEAEVTYAEVLERSQHHPALAARALLGLASRCLLESEQDRAERLLERARILATEAADRILLGRVLNNMGIVHQRNKRYQQALEYFRLALEVRKGIGYRNGVIINLHNIGDTHFRMEDYPRAYAAFEQSAEQARETDWHRGVAMNEIYIGYLDAARGKVSGIDMLKNATQRARAFNDEESAATGLWLQARWAHRQGDRQGAERLMESARDLAQSCGSVTLLRDFDEMQVRTAP